MTQGQAKQLLRYEPGSGKLFFGGNGLVAL